MIQKKVYQEENSRFIRLKNFLFPLLPLKVFSSINSIAMLAVLIALRMVLQFASIYIPVFGFSISISWTPLIIIGWIYGPIYGMVAGVITDSLGILISASTWFWLYAIQEPMVGFISALFGYFCRLRLTTKQTKIKHNFIDFMIFQIMLLVFSGVCIYALLTQTINNLSFEGKSQFEEFFFKYSIWIILGSILFFLLFMELLGIIFFKKYTKNFTLCSWIIALVCTLSILMSFILGPISANAYYKYMYGVDSPYFIKYGVIFYLIPRTFKESIKAPIEISILVIVIPIANQYINEIKMLKVLKWKTTSR